MRSAHWSDAYVRGLAGALVTALAGTWLAAAPFVFAYQADGEEWVDATRVGVWTGALLIVVGFLAAALLAAGIRGEVATARTPANQQEPAYEDLDRAMVEVTAALLADLHGPQGGLRDAASEVNPSLQDRRGRS